MHFSGGFQGAVAITPQMPYCDELVFGFLPLQHVRSFFNDSHLDWVTFSPKEASAWFPWGSWSLSSEWPAIIRWTWQLQFFLLLFFFFFWSSQNDKSLGWLPLYPNFSINPYNDCPWFSNFHLQILMCFFSSRWLQHLHNLQPEWPGTQLIIEGVHSPSLSCLFPKVLAVI